MKDIIRLRHKYRFRSRSYRIKINKIRAYKRLFSNLRINRFLRVMDALAYKRKFHNCRCNQCINHFPIGLKQSLNFNSERVVYIKDLPLYFSRRMLFHLFKKEGRILFCKIYYDDLGFPKGVGKIEFEEPRVASKVIKKWNNLPFRGTVLKLGNKYENQENENDIGHHSLFRNFRNHSNNEKYPIYYKTRNFNRYHNKRNKSFN